MNMQNFLSVLIFPLSCTPTFAQQRESINSQDIAEDTTGIVKINVVDSNAVYEIILERIVQIIQNEYKGYQLKNPFYSFNSMGRTYEIPHSVDKPLEGSL